MKVFKILRLRKTDKKFTYASNGAFVNLHAYRVQLTQRNWVVFDIDYIGSTDIQYKAYLTSVDMKTIWMCREYFRYRDRDED